MITAGWEAVRRPHDGEAVGYLVADGPLAVPVTLAGQPLGPAQEADAATALLIGHGLAAIGRRWWCRLPDPLPRGVLAAGHPLPGWDWRAVVLVEVSPTACRVRPEWPSPGELTGQAVLPVPVGQLLVAEPTGVSDGPRARRSTPGTERYVGGGPARAIVAASSP